MQNKKTLIFDLDGTLLNSIEDIAICMNIVLKDLNLPTYKIEEYKYFVGYGVDVLISNVLKDASKELIEDAIKRFKIVYDSNDNKNTIPYNGIIELLNELTKLDCNLAVLSNKPHELTQASIKKIFKDYEFKEVHGQKYDVPKKPDPIAAINIAKSLDIPCEKIYFVGDTKVDMQTAKSANMKAIGVLWGFRGKEELLEFGADFLVEHPLEILDIINK